MPHDGDGLCTHALAKCPLDGTFSPHFHIGGSEGLGLPHQDDGVEKLELLNHSKMSLNRPCFITSGCTQQDLDPDLVMITPKAKEMEEEREKLGI